MNSVLNKTLKTTTPRMNKKFMTGLAIDVFDTIPQYLDEMIKISLSKLGSSVPLRYIGIQRITPEEELMEDAYGRATNKPVDISSNNVILYKFMFEYNGEYMPMYIYLGYVEPGNVFTISGTHYVVTPVLTDLVLSVKPDEIFVRLHRDKIHVRSEKKRIKLNNNSTPELMRYLYSNIFNAGGKDKSKPEKIRPNFKTPLGLYLLCKYGLDYTIRNFCKLNVNDVKIIYDSNDNIEVDDEYNIYGSVGEKPRGYVRSSQYRKHRVKILVKKGIVPDAILSNIIVSIITSFDMINGEIEEELVDAIQRSDLDSPRGEKAIWRVLLGKSIYRDFISIEKVIKDIEEHIENLDDYVDDVIKRLLLSSGIVANNFWELLVYIFKVYVDAVNNAKTYSANINNVYVDIYYYICYEIIVGFNRAIKVIKQRKEKLGTRIPSKDEVKRILNKHVSEKIIYKLIKSSQQSLAMAQADVANDSLYYKLTSQLENQNRGEGVRRGGKTPFPDSIKTLAGYMLSFGSLLYLIKAAPSPSLRGNPWMQLDNVGHIVIDNELKPTINKLDKIFKGITDADFEFVNALNNNDEQEDADDACDDVSITPNDDNDDIDINSED